MGADTSNVHLIDGFPIEVCKLTRVKRSKIFKGEAAFGHCASKDIKYYGFCGNLLTDERGIPVDLTVTAANIDERDSVFDVLGRMIKGLLIGDKGFIRPSLTGLTHQY